MPSDEFIAFEFKDALVAAITAEIALAGSPIEGADLLDAWPAERIVGRDTVLVLDIDGDSQPATLRAGGGTRNEVFNVDVVVAAVRRTKNAREVRVAAAAMGKRVAQLVQAEAGAGAPPFGVPQVRQALVTGAYSIREYVHDKGRECDLRYRVEVLARLRP